MNGGNLSFLFGKAKCLLQVVINRNVPAINVSLPSLGHEHESVSDVNTPTQARTRLFF